MARQYLFTFFIIAVVLPTVTFAREFIVGDETGWTTKYDYEGWAKGKEFRVGDKLVFKYTIGLHNVYQVNEDAYKNCIIPQDGVLASGEDAITLDSPGPKYFVCGVGLHCDTSGQKLSVNVKQEDTQAPTQGTKAPSQSPAANGSPYAAPSQSLTTNDSPYLASSQFPTANDSPNETPSQLSASHNSSNGCKKTIYHLSLFVGVAIVAVIIF